MHFIFRFKTKKIVYIQCAYPSHTVQKKVRKKCEQCRENAVNIIAEYVYNKSQMVCKKSYLQSGTCHKRVKTMEMSKLIAPSVNVLFPQSDTWQW
jgi:hypothetical protein